MTRQAFLNAYRARLVALYPWAADAARLERFMASVAETIQPNGANRWNHDGDAVTAAWRDIGGKGKPNLTALRNLPVGDTAACSPDEREARARGWRPCEDGRGGFYRPAFPHYAFSWADCLEKDRFAAERHREKWGV